MTRHSIGSPPSAGQDAQTTENELGYDWGKNNLSLKGKVNPHSEKTGHSDILAQGLLQKRMIF